MFGRKSIDLAYHPLVFLGIAHDASLADLAFSNLELRFDQDYHVSILGQEPGEDRNYFRYRDERYIHHYKIEDRVEIVSSDSPGIGFFADLYTRVFTKLPDKLICACIDGHHTGRAVLKQAIGKSAGRCSYI